MRAIPIEIPEGFIHTCCFERQLTYPYIQDNFYLIEMESGRYAVYERSINDNTIYNGTGQHDWEFKFIRYINKPEFEIVSSLSPMGFTKYTVRLKDGVNI